MNQPGAKSQQQEEISLRTLLQEMIQRGASDLHITVGNPAKMRIDGDLQNSKTGRVLAPKDTLSIAYSILTENQKKRFETEDELAFSFGVQNLSRFRGNVYKQRGCVAMAIRQIPYEIISIEKLGLPPVINKLAERPRGLVLVTGPTGSGKSTTLAAMVDKVNKERKGHILTVEDPIEFIHRHQNCMINQREVGADTNSFKAALKYALRQDPDVILIGEMRDLETIAAALTIAETGHLVFATLHTNSAAESINRMIDAPAGPGAGPAGFCAGGRHHPDPPSQGQGQGTGGRGGGHDLHARHPGRHPGREDPPDLLPHAGREEARHADHERRAAASLHEGRGDAGRGAQAIPGPGGVAPGGGRARTPVPAMTATTPNQNETR